MERVTYNQVKLWVEQWNNGHPDLPFQLTAYNGCYHLYRKNNGGKLCSGETPREVWELFGMWKTGYYEGRDAG